MEAPGNIVMAVLWLLGGLGLFLYGIDMMGTALRRSAGGRLRYAFDIASRTRLRGLAIGTFVTALMQSSSATTVMVVGFINAGLLNLHQSLGIIIGANIGTTITPQITAFNLDHYALPLLGAGFLFYVLSRHRLSRQLGLAVMGFGMLFFGLSLMKFAVADYHNVIHRGLAFAAGQGIVGYATAFLASMLATAVIQSSAASIVMVQTLAFEGIITDVTIAIPLVLGAHVGTCITALLASLQSSLSARRAALAHLFFNLIGTLLTLLLLPLYTRFIPLTATTFPHQIANTHLIIKLVNAAVFIPFLTYFGRFIRLVCGGTEKLSATPQFLDFNAIRHPDHAITLAHQEIQRMYAAALTLLNDAVHAFVANDEHAQEEILQREDRLDDLYRTIGEYLISISKQTSYSELALKPTWLLHIGSDAERIGDHAENIVELARMIPGTRQSFSHAALRNVAALNRHIQTLGADVAAMFEKADDADSAKALTDKQALNACVDHCLDAHTARLEEGTCDAINDILFVELVMNLHRVANHLRNIAISLGHDRPEQSGEVRRIREDLDWEERR